MSLDEWLARIGAVHPVKWDLGLERVAAVGRRLDVLSPAPTVFLVAGTNGKGSTCMAIAALCGLQGRHVGVTTSPHLIRFNERIVIDGRAADDEEICGAFARIEAARGDISLTYFEFAALAAMDIFVRREVDVAVMEIGLGGRLDAMNIVEPDVSVITRIAMDHESWLGDNRQAIAREKAGIMRSGRPCIVADADPPDALGLCAAEVGARPLWIDRDFGRDVQQGIYAAGAAGRLAFHRPGDPVVPEASVLAAIQAVTVAGMVPTEEQVDAVYNTLRVPGRFQEVAMPRRTVLDVAHNPDAAAWLARRLAREKRGRCHALVGMYRDKDYASVIAALAPLVDYWYVCRADEPRAAGTEELAGTVRRAGGSVVGRYDKVSAAYDLAVVNTTAMDLILVFGSFPIVGGVLEHLGVMQPTV